MQEPKYCVKHSIDDVFTGQDCIKPVSGEADTREEIRTTLTYLQVWTDNFFNATTGSAEKCAFDRMRSLFEVKDYFDQVFKPQLISTKAFRNGPQDTYTVFGNFLFCKLSKTKYSVQTHAIQHYGTNNTIGFINPWTMVNIKNSWYIESLSYGCTDC